MTMINKSEVRNKCTENMRFWDYEQVFRLSGYNIPLIFLAFKLKVGHAKHTKCQKTNLKRLDL